MIAIGLAILVGVAVAILASEAKAWLSHLSAWMLERALAKLPDGLPDEVRERWENEIRADLCRYDDRPFGGLVFVIGLRRKGIKRLAADLALQEAIAPPAGSPEEDSEGESDKVKPVGSKPMVTEGKDQIFSWRDLESSLLKWEHLNRPPRFSYFQNLLRSDPWMTESGVEDGGPATPAQGLWIPESGAGKAALERVVREEIHRSRSGHGR